MDLSRFPRRRYTDGPTPLHFLPNFTAKVDPLDENFPQNPAVEAILK